MPSLKNTNLEPSHFQHLIGEGFTSDQIHTMETWGVKSLTEAKAEALGFKLWDKLQRKYLTDGGLNFPHSKAFGQIRFNNPLRPKNKKEVKYLSTANSDPVMWLAGTNLEQLEAATEGFKDAAICTLNGIKTGGFTGIDFVPYNVPQGWGKPIIFDSDGWRNPSVMAGLIKAALWTEGKINLFPEMEAYPKGGACEFFLTGHTADDYLALIEESYDPKDLLVKWSEKFIHYDDTLRYECVRVYCEAIEKLKQPREWLTYQQYRLEKKREEKQQNRAAKVAA